MDLEDTRRRPTEGEAHLEATQVSQPYPRSADPSGSHLSASFASQFFIALAQILLLWDTTNQYFVYASSTSKFSL
jgi:hypothetical protein